MDQLQHNGMLHIAFHSEHPDDLLAFYCGIFGMHVQRQRVLPEDLPETDPRYALRGKPAVIYLEDKSGAVLEIFALVPGSKPAVDAVDRVGFSHIAFAVPDLQASVAFLREKGVVIERAPAPGEPGPAFIRDPDGNRVELLPA